MLFGTNYTQLNQMLSVPYLAGFIISFVNPHTGLGARQSMQSFSIKTGIIYICLISQELEMNVSSVHFSRETI